MPSRILKWAIPVDDAEHSFDGEFLHAEPMTSLEREQASGHPIPTEYVTIWIRVTEPKTDNERWHYQIYGTGQVIDDDRLIHMATVRQLPFVWHILGRPEFRIQGHGHQVERVILDEPETLEHKVPN